MHDAIPEHHVSLQCNISEAAYPVLGLHGTERVSRLPRITIALKLPPDPCLATSLPGQNALIRIATAEGTRVIPGIVCKSTVTDTLTDGFLRCEVVLTSTLFHFSLRRNTRLLPAHNPIDALHALLADHGIDPSILDLRLTGNFPPPPALFQAAETDAQFIDRVFARNGISYWFEADNEQEKLVLANGPGQYRRHTRTLPYRRAAGWGSQQTGVFALSAHSRQVAERVHLQARLPSGELIHAEAATNAPGADGIAEHFAYGLQDLPAVEQRARLLAEQLRCQAGALYVDTTDATLQPGMLITLDADDFDPRHSGDYLIIELVHRTDALTSPEPGNATLAYRNRATLWPAHLPWRAKEPRPDAPRPMLYAARVLSDGPYAQLDETGRYRLRALFRRLGSDGPPLGRLSPYAGPHHRQAIGWHLPILDGQEVRITCLGGDPDAWALVTTTLPDAARRSPVNHHNPMQNRYQSASGNTLLMDDRVGEAQISLHTLGEHTLLALHANNDLHKALFAARHGVMLLYAGRHLYAESGKNLEETVNADRLQQVHKRSTTRTDKAYIHHEGASDIRLAAKEHLRLHARESLSLKAMLRVHTVAGRGLHARIHHGDLDIAVNGNLHIEGRNALRIEGDGGSDMHISLNGHAGFIVHADGNVTLYGNSLALDAPNVSLKGNVSYDIGTPQIPSAPAVPGISAVPPIASLSFAQEVTDTETFDLTIDIDDEFRRNLDTFHDLRDGTPYRIITGGKNAREGVIANQRIEEPHINITHGLKFEFESHIEDATGTATP